MADILDILIEILKIDCSVTQCNYANSIEGLFYLFFFPTVFIILFIYILTSFIFRGGGKVKGIKFLIALGAYAFIIFEGLYTFFAAVSHLWWLLTILLVGLFAFIRYLIRGGDGGSSGNLGRPGVTGEFRQSLGKLIVKRKIEEPLIKSLGLESSEEKEYRKIREKYEDVGRDLNKLEPGERAIMELTMGMAGSGATSTKQIRDLKALLKSESKGD